MEWEESICRISAHIATIFFGGLHLVGIDGIRRRQQQEEGSIAVGGVQFGTTANEAKVFKAHAAPRGLCENFINALNLMVNQQKDGDSPIQRIVTGLHERNRKGVMDRLRSFIEVDNHSAVVLFAGGLLSSLTYGVRR